MIDIDLETRSEADLLKTGAWVYSEHPSTEVICFAYKIGNQPIKRWWMGDPEPTDLRYAIAMGEPVRAFGNFERCLWPNVMVARLGFIEILDHQWRDLQAVAGYLSLPMKLSKLLRALEFNDKDPEGARLIQRYSKLHLKNARRDIPPEDKQRWLDYVARDVEAQRELGDALGDLPAPELEIFKLDHTINMRGLALDAAGIEAASRVVDGINDRLTAEFREATGLNPTQRDKVLAWLATKGVVLGDYSAETIEQYLDEHRITLPKDVRDLLEIKVEIGRSSTRKLDKMLAQRGKDGRSRWQTRYHGAGTGRNTGDGWQPLNLVRSWEYIPPEVLVRDVMREDPDWLRVVYGDAIEAVAKAARHWIVAAPGHRLMANDFVSVEAVVLSCFAGEEWKVQAFRDREPIYCRTAEKIYKLPKGAVTKHGTPDQYKDGKTCELACGYQGALNAWRKFDNTDRHTDEAVIGHVRNWRDENPMIKLSWYGMQDAAIECVQTGADTGYRDIGFSMDGQFLNMVLPNGKLLWYFKPELRMGMPQWHQPGEDEDCARGTCQCKPVLKLSYMANKTGRWGRVYTYGGKLVENAVQAMSRERLWISAQRVEKAGYPIVLTVYDEIVCEVPNGRGSLKEFEEIMAEPAGDWDADWPINVEGWEGQRYKK